MTRRREQESQTTPATIALTLDDATLGRLADLVVARLPRTSSATADGWLDAKRAARYLGFDSVHPLHRLTARREIVFSQDGPRSKLWFRIADLDAYRERGCIEARERRDW